MYGSGYMLGDYSMIFAVLCFGSLLVAIGIFISSLTESQVIAAVLTLIVNILLYLWNMVTYYVPSEPFGVLIGFVILWLVACMICYSISKNLNLALIMAVLGVGVMGVLYLYNADMFEGKLASFLSILSITAPLDNFSDYSVFDVGGIFFYISFSALLLFLTVQTVQKRRLG
jgi:ABC-2 type transport system permease protein